MKYSDCHEQSYHFVNMVLLFRKNILIQKICLRPIMCRTNLKKRMTYSYLFSCLPQEWQAKVFNFFIL